MTANKTPASGAAKTALLPSLRKTALLILLLLPVLTVCLEFRLRDASGPFWLGENLDPGYAYLLNSLNVADYHRPYFIGHPGTPVHLVGGGVIRAMNARTGRQETVKEVLTNPERYMTAINGVLVVFCGFCALIAGLIVFIASRSLFSALIVQATPFFSITTFSGLTSVRPEPMMIGLATLVAGLVILTLKTDTRKYALRYVLAFAVLVGIGLAGKVNFLPVALVPLIILPGWKSRLSFLGATILAFILAILPILEPTLIRETIQFMFNLATHTGRYGSGSAGFIEPLNYLRASIVLINGEALFFLIVLTGIVVLACRSKFPALQGARFKVLLAVTVAQIVQLLMVAKHPASRYLIPSLALISVNVVVLFEVIRERLPAYRLPLLGLAVLVITSYQIWGFNTLFRESRAATHTQLAVYESVRTTAANVPVVTYYTSSSPHYALDFGSGYSGNLYRGVLQQLYPNQFFYSPWTGKFSDFGGPVTIDQLRKVSPWFILTGCSLSDSDFKGFLPPKPLPDQITIEPLSGTSVDHPGLLDCGAIYKASITDDEDN